MFVMYDVYNDEDIILKDRYSMVTSYRTGKHIIIAIYENSQTTSNPVWRLRDNFSVSPKVFQSMKDNMAYVVAKYVTESCSSEAIHDRIYK